MAASLMFVSLPLALGSFVSLAVFAFYPFVLTSRIRSEEALLTRGLPGYAQYKEKVRFRMIPFLW